MGYFLCIFTLLGILSIATGAPATLQLHLFPESSSSEAVCNDGSPAGLWLDLQDLDKWIIDLGGGGWCMDDSTCKDRMKGSPNLMSSKAWPKNVTVGGIFDLDPTLNPGFATFSKASVGYCSSDSFSGDRAASADTFGWHFRGKRIMAETLTYLQQFGLGTASEVLLNGCSAGGVAVIANLDYVKSKLPNLQGRKVRGHSDAGWMLDANPWPPSHYGGITPFLKVGSVLWGGIPDDDCAKAMPTEAWKCYFGGIVTPYLQTPHFAHQDSEDSVQIIFNGVFGPYNQTTLAYVNDWRANITKTV